MMKRKLTAAELDAWYQAISTRIDARIAKRKAELILGRSRDPHAIEAEQRIERRRRDAAVAIRKGTERKR